MPQVKSLKNNKQQQQNKQTNNNSKTICVPKSSQTYNLPDTCWVEQQGS